MLIRVTLRLLGYRCTILVSEDVPVAWSAHVIMSPHQDGRLVLFLMACNIRQKSRSQGQKMYGLWYCLIFASCSALRLYSAVVRSARYQCVRGTRASLV